MKIQLISSYDNGVLIKLSYRMLSLLGWKAGDTIELDIPMTGGGLTIHKVEQRVGDETI